MKKHYVASAIIIRNGRIMMLKHPELNKWLFPGGHVELNESPVDTVLREVMEEVGCDIKLINYYSAIDYHDNSSNTICLPYLILQEKQKDHYHIDFIYVAELVDQKISSENNEIIWVGPNEYKKLDTFDNVLFILNNIFNQI